MKFFSNMAYLRSNWGQVSKDILLVLFYSALLCVYFHSWMINVVYLPILLRVASLSLGNHTSCPSDIEVVLIGMDNTNQYQPW